MIIEMSQFSDRRSSSTTTTSSGSSTSSSLSYPKFAEKLWNAAADYGFQVYPAFLRRSYSFYQAGAEMAVFMHIIEQTSEADYPSQKYALSILSRYSKSGFKTMAAVSADEASFYGQHRRTVAKQRYNPAGDFIRHEYKPEDFEDLYIKIDDYPNE